MALLNAIAEGFQQEVAARTASWETVVAREEHGITSASSDDSILQDEAGVTDHQ